MFSSTVFSKGHKQSMFYHQLDRSNTQIDTVSCGPSWFYLQFHIARRIPKPTTYSRLTQTLTPAPLHSDISNPTNGNVRSNAIIAGGGSGNKIVAILTRLMACITRILQYLWISRISLRFDQIPMLLLVIIAFFVSLICYLEPYTNHHSWFSPYFQRDTSEYSGPLTLNQQLELVNNHYPETYILTGSPLSRGDLGHITWQFLHTMAANYPEEPTAQRQQDLIDFWRVFARLYPCGECAKHMRKNLEINSPNKFVNNNRDYSQWVCQFHNQVNGQLNKPLLDCSDVDSILKQWQSNEYCGCENEVIEGVDSSADIAAAAAKNDGTATNSDNKSLNSDNKRMLIERNALMGQSIPNENVANNEESEMINPIKIN